jgi:hypothetical protein
MSTNPTPAPQQMEELIRDGRLTPLEAAHLVDHLDRASEAAWDAAGPTHPAEPLPEMVRDLNGLAVDARDATRDLGLREPGETSGEFLERTEREMERAEAEQAQAARDGGKTCDCDYPACRSGELPSALQAPGRDEAEQPTAERDERQAEPEPEPEPEAEAGQ